MATNLALTENFYFNNMLARALLQVMPRSERSVLLEWFDRLVEMKRTPQELEIRKDYMLFILLMLQSQKIKPPFTESPPENILPLKEFVNKKNYEETILFNDDIAISSVEQGQGEEINPKKVLCPPAKFFRRQPCPNEGVICYASVFSSQEKCD